jgi:hypothetical protein
VEPTFAEKLRIEESEERLRKLRTEKMKQNLEVLVHYLRSEDFQLLSISLLESYQLETDSVEFRLRLALRAGAPPTGDSKERKDV